MDKFYLIGFDEAGYSEIPDDSFDFVILSHVIEHMPNAAAMLKVICSKLKPSGYIWIAFPSPKSLGFPSAEGTLQFCDDPTHVYVPDIREVSNVLLKCGMKVLHAGRSRDRVREFIGAMILPWAFLKRSITGRLSARGLWNIMGFEDHVFAQRKDF